MVDECEITAFTQRVRKDGSSLVLTLDYKVAEFEGIKEGDWVKLWVKKLIQDKKITEEVTENETDHKEEQPQQSTV